MTDPQPVETATVERFPSLAAMSAAHRELLKRQREAGDTPLILTDIESFILKGRATGALLDDEDSRWVAQGQLDYWTTKTYRSNYNPPDGTLTEFDPSLAPELPDDLCPYLGLDAFNEHDRDVFFGRQQQLDSLLKVLADHRLLAIVGSSGSGKSSLVFGGLLPKLKAGALPGSAGWRYLKRLVPGQDPLLDLARLLQPAGVENPDWAAEQSKGFLESTSHLTLLVEKDGSTPVVLLVDQFEEIFTLCPDEATRQAFINNLLGLIESPNAEHRLILTVRVDFQSQVARVDRLQKYFIDGAVAVAPFSASELRDTIEKPAALIGLKYEEGLVDQLVRDVLGEPAALPLLQFTLQKLWERRERNRMTWAAYQKMGGGRNALAYSADELYNSLIPEDQVACKRILLKIVRPGEGLEVTSNRVLRSSLYRGADAADRVDRVLDRLLKAHLLRQTEGETPELAQVEVAHEALVRNWPTLVEWLDEERSNLRNRLRLTAAAKQWRQLGREKGALLRGVMLHIAESYDDLSDLEQEYLQASRSALEAAQKQQEEQRRRELEQAQALAAARERQLEQAETLAAEQSKRAEAERRQSETLVRTAKQLRRRAVLLTIVAVAAVVFAFTAVFLARRAAASAAEAQDNARMAEVNANEAQVQASTAQAASTKAVANAEYANQQRQLAQDQQATAQAASTQAVAQQGTAVAESNVAATARADAVSQANIAFSRQLAAQAFNYLDNYPALSLLLSVEAMRSEDTLEARSALLSGLQRGLSQKTILAGSPLVSKDGYVYSTAFSRDGKYVAAGTADGPVLLWNTADGTLFQTLSGHAGQVFGLSFSPDGRTLASASADGTIILWNYAAGQQIFRSPQSPFAALSIAFNPGGSSLAVGRNNGTTELWDVAGQKLSSQLTGHQDKVWSVAWSPDGRQLATGSADSTARIWEPGTATAREVLRGHSRAVRSVVWSRDGRLLVTGSQDGTILIWSTADGTRSGDPLTAHTDQVLTLALSPDGRTLASGSADRSVILWDLNSRALLDRLIDHVHWVSSLAFSADGKLLSSGSYDNSLVLRSVVVQQQLGTGLAGNHGPVRAMIINAAGNPVTVVQSQDEPASLVSTDALKRLAMPQGYRVLALGADGGRLALSGKAGLRLFDAAQGQLLPVTFANAILPPLAAAFSPDGRLLAASSCQQSDTQTGFCPNNVIQVWDTSTGSLVHQLNTPHTDAIMSLAFGEDGQTLASGGADTIIVLWDLSGEQALGLTLAGHKGAVTSLAFSPDGRTLASGSTDADVILWNVDTLQPVGNPLTGHTRSVSALAFDAKGANLVSADSRGDLVLWSVSPDAWRARACDLAKRNLTQDEWNQFLRSGAGDYRKTCDQWPDGS